MNKTVCALLAAVLLALAVWHIRQMRAVARAGARIRPQTQSGPTRRTSSGRAKGETVASSLASIIQEV